MFFHTSLCLRLYSLLAEDVMSEHISFLYPITRVGSLYRLLKTTTYSAFPVVTPLTTHSKPTMSVTNRHVPTLYGDTFSLGKDAVVNDDRFGQEGMGEEGHVGTEETPSKSDRRRRTTFQPARVQSYRRRTFRRPAGQGTEISAQLHDGDGLEYSYPIPPSQSLTGELQSSKTHTRDKTPLVLHGMILRSQLIQLLKMKTFFDEHSQASFNLNLNFLQHSFHLLTLCL